MANVGEITAMIRRSASSGRWVAASAIATLLLWAGPARAEGGGGDFYLGDLGQAIATVVIFVILLVILGRWGWRPIVERLERRERTITDTLDNAQKRETEAHDVLVHYRSRMETAEADAKQVIAGAHRQVAEAREEVLTAARSEAREFAQRAKTEIEQARRAAKSQLHQDAAELSAEIAARVLRKAIGPDEHRRLVDESIAQISRQSSGAGE